MVLVAPSRMKTCGHSCREVASVGAAETLAQPARLNIASHRNTFTDFFTLIPFSVFTTLQFPDKFALRPKRCVPALYLKTLAIHTVRNYRSGKTSLVELVEKALGASAWSSASSCRRVHSRLSLVDLQSLLNSVFFKLLIRKNDAHGKNLFPDIQDGWSDTTGPPL